jgi:hypothetical protein
LEIMPRTGIGGFMVGSVAMSVVAHATQPVALVRAGEQAADEHELDPMGIPSAATAFRPVALGLDTDVPDDSAIEFAFAEAARRHTSLRVVHGWNPPPCYVYGLSADPGLRAELGRRQAETLAEVLRPWRQGPHRPRHPLRPAPRHRPRRRRRARLTHPEEQTS